MINRQYIFRALRLTTQPPSSSSSSSYVSLSLLIAPTTASKHHLPKLSSTESQSRKVAPLLLHYLDCIVVVDPQDPDPSGAARGRGEQQRLAALDDAPELQVGTTVLLTPLVQRGGELVDAVVVGVGLADGRAERRRLRA